MDQLALLRTTTQRLVNTPVNDLPRIAAFLGSSLANCAAVLDGGKVSASDSAVPLHKLRTRLSALLQDRAPAGRLSAAIIIKSVTEKSQPSESAHWETWARGLIGCLNRSDPWELKRVYLLAAARIFLLARGVPTLHREVTLPLLPAFLTATLAVVKPVTIQQSQKQDIITSPLLPTVLNCWNELIQDHAATIRPFASRIKSICLSLVSDFACAADLRETALRSLSSLHLCAPKGGSASEWQTTASSIVQATHDALDVLFRGVFEEWRPSDTHELKSTLKHDYGREPGTSENDMAGLTPWKGVDQGALRVINLLRWAHEMLRCQCTTTLVPVGLFVDLTARINGTLVPKITQKHQRHNPEVGKDEREAVWSWLPMLHLHSLTLLSTLMRVFGKAACPLTLSISEQIFDVFDAESRYENVRREFYDSLCSVLQEQTLARLPLDKNSIQQICKQCCSDIETLRGRSQPQPTGSEPNRSAQKEVPVISLPTAPDTYKLSTVISPDLALLSSAQKLLRLILAELPPESSSHAARTELDRISILTGDEQAMFASVMNPPRRRPGERVLPSVLPFYARWSDCANMNLEAIVRPRMPLIHEGSRVFEADRATSNYDGSVAANGSRDDHSLQAQGIQVAEQTGPEQLGDTEEPVHATAESILGKRDFTTMNAASTSGIEIASSESKVGVDAKQSRNWVMDETLVSAQGPEALSALSTQERQDDSMIIVPTDLNTDNQHFVQPFGEEVVDPSKPTAPLIQNESDSDSDIPTIDPTLATDDEDEEDKTME